MVNNEMDYMGSPEISGAYVKYHTLQKLKFERVVQSLKSKVTIAYSPLYSKQVYFGMNYPYEITSPILGRLTIPLTLAMHRKFRVIHYMALLPMNIVK